MFKTLKLPKQKPAPYTMSKKIGVILNEIFGLVGIDGTQDAFKDLIALPQEVDDVTAEKLSKNLLTIEAAKMNGQLKAHFKAQTLNGVDAQHNELAAEYGLTAEETAELTAIKDTFERNKKLVAKVKENTAKLNAGKGDTAALAAENAKLNTLILANKTAADAALAAAQAKHDGDLTDYAITSHLRSLKYANDKVDADVNAMTAQNIIKAALAEKKAGIKRAPDNTLKLFQLEHPELDYLDNHKAVSFADLASTVLQGKNMLAVNDPNKRAAGKPGAPAAPGTPAPAAIDNTEAVDFYSQQLEQFAQ